MLLLDLISVDLTQPCIHVYRDIGSAFHVSSLERCERLVQVRSDLLLVDLLLRTRAGEMGFDSSRDGFPPLEIFGPP